MQGRLCCVLSFLETDVSTKRLVGVETVAGRTHSPLYKSPGVLSVGKEIFRVVVLLCLD